MINDVNYRYNNFRITLHVELMSHACYDSS